MEPFRAFADLICTIPGIGIRTAEVIVAETGADMTVFPTAGHFASWAGRRRCVRAGDGRAVGRAVRGCPGCLPVATASLPAANSLSAANNSLARLIGPAAGRLLYAAAEVP